MVRAAHPRTSQDSEDDDFDPGSWDDLGDAKQGV